MKTEWNVKIYEKKGVLKMKVEYEGEVPTTKAWKDLLSTLGEWCMEHNSTPLEVFNIQPITSP